MAESKTRIYEEGNYGFMIAPLNTDGTYGDVQKIEGMVSIDCTMSRTVTNTPADDIVDYITRTSPESGEGTLTFRGLSVEDYEKLYNSITDENGALTFGRRVSPKKVGISFFNTQSYKDALGEEKSSTNKFTLNSVIFQLPNLSTTTMAEDDTTTRDFELSFNANAYNFTNKKGGSDRVTWSIVNSEDNADIWENVKDEIYVPDKDYTA